MRTVNLVLGLATAGLSLLNSAGATPISASMGLEAKAQLDSTEIAMTDFDSQAWGTLLAPLSVSAAATVTDEDGISATATGEGSATWGAGGNSGSVVFTNYGWLVSPSATGAVSLGFGSLSDWVYTFIADANGTFAMSYDVTATGTFLFGLQGWNIGWSGPGAGLSLIDVLDPTASGTFTRSVVAGQTYTVDLTNAANVSGGIGGIDAHMSGVFDFTITPRAAVPEPATLALLGLGLAGLGFSRRKQ